jgi:mono/diheme cytochrome c family protein
MGVKTGPRVSRRQGLSLVGNQTRWGFRCFSLVAFAAFLLGDPRLGLGDIPVSSLSVANSNSIPKLVEKYCFECHGDGVAKGKIDLEEMLDPEKRAAHREEWARAWKIVRHEFMPPVGHDLPSGAERKAITAWIAQTMLGVDFAHPDPGRVTARRLNRVEYEYTVQDLFGVNFNSEVVFSSDNPDVTMRLRDRLPPDDTAFGFDNIGDFQTVSPGLLEKFFDIAEFVVDRVIVQDGPRDPEVDLGGPEVKAVKSTTGKQTDHTREFKVEQPGRYRADFQFTLGGWQDYGGAYEFILRLNDAELVKDEVEVGGYKTYKYSKIVELKPGEQMLSFSTDPRRPDAKGKTNHLELRPRIKLVGPIGSGAREYPESHRKIFFKGTAPADERERREYAKAILKRVVERAFRRPVDDQTVKGLVELAMRGATFERGVGQALTAILTSPRFLFRSEAQPRPDDPKSVHPLDEYSLASRLSYLLWLSLPDEELTRLAAEGKLRQNLKSQVKRMLADSKSERFFEDFPGQWLRTRNVLMTAISKDEMLRPVRGAMKRETEMLFEHVARNDHDLVELVTADYTFLNQKLAEFYDIKGVSGDEFRKVQLAPETKRGGLLTQGSFLVASSNPNRTSPVKRGLFILENLLATEIPPPPANIPPLDDAKVGGATPKTVREQLAAHRENKSCAACHAHFDPFGVALENYDLIGHWREKDSGEVIEPHETTVTGETLSGPEDVRKLFLSRKDKFYRCVSEKLLTYALGRGLEPYDAVTVDRIADEVAADNGKFSTLLLGVVESPAFQTRRGDDGSVKSAPRNLVPATPPPEKRRPQRRRPAEVNAEAPAPSSARTENKPATP